MYFIISFVLIQSLKAATLIQPVTLINSYASICVSQGKCCACSTYSSCDSNNDCYCLTNSSNSKMYGNTCLLTSTQNTAVSKQTLSGADESLISDFSVIQVYDLLSRSTTLTYKQLYTIYQLGITLASNSVQQSEIDWYLRSVQLITKKLAQITTLETNTLQTFQIEILDLIRALMFKHIDLDSTKSIYQYEIGYFSAIIANWKDTISYTNMTVNGKSIPSAKCEFKGKSVLVKYKFILAVDDVMVNSFLNTSFAFNSSVIYCQYMDKYGDIYYPPSSEFYYQHYLPSYTYETLLSTQDVIGLGCFQIQLSNSVYSLVYNNQDCQYKSISDSRPTPYCQCNSPGVTFIEVLWSDSKIKSITSSSSVTNTTVTESSFYQLIKYKLIMILLLII